MSRNTKHMKHYKKYMSRNFDIASYEVTSSTKKSTDTISNQHKIQKQ